MQLIVVFAFLWRFMLCSAELTQSGTVHDAFQEEIDDSDLELKYDVLDLTVPKHIKMNDINAYHEIVLPAYSNTKIQLKNMSDHEANVGFALVQLHAYEFNVTLSYTNTIIDGQHVFGSNVGLVLYRDGNLYAINNHPHANIMVALVLMLYNRTAPIPGGCTMEFPKLTSPVLNLILKSSTIEIDTPLAAVAPPFLNPKTQCGKAEMIYESYYLSMPTYDFSQRTYFAYIRKLISYVSAKASGRLNKLEGDNFPQVKRVYDRQVGRGMVFVTLAIDPIDKGFAAYVPIQTYACNPFLQITGCYEFNIPVRITGFIITIAMVAEIVIGFMPTHFKAFICGGIIGLLGTIKTLKSFNLMVNDSELITLLVVGAIACAFIFVALTCAAPIVSNIICNFLTGVLLCTTMFYGAYGSLFSNPYILIAVFTGGIIAGIALSSLRIFLYTNGFLFGAVSLFYGINTVFSARLHYPLRNIAHGLMEEGYENVVSDSTLDSNEIMAIVAFIMIVAVSFYLRARCKLHSENENREEPLFASWVVCSKRRGSSTSLVYLADDSSAYDFSGRPTITRWASGEDDVFESPETNSRFFERFHRRFRPRQYTSPFD